MILVFAGAGASCAVSADDYPTTVEFFNRLPSEVLSEPLFKEMVAYVRSKKGDDVVDIEEVLWALGDVRKTYGDVVNKSSAAGYLIRRPNAKSIGRFHNDLGDPIKGMEQFSILANELADLINRQVFGLYSVLPSVEQLSKNWLPLLKGLTQLNEGVELFTTNYDQVLEHAFVVGDLAFETGSTSLPRPTLDISCWHESRSRKERNQLTKLHGSIDWSHGDEVIHTGTPTYKGDLDAHVMLFPGSKGEADIQPYLAFHEYFQDKCLEARCAIFIGFGFRDDYINQILHETLETGTTIIILNPSELPTDLPFESRDVIHIDAGFDTKTVSQVLDYV